MLSGKCQQRFDNIVFGTRSILTHQMEANLKDTNNRHSSKLIGLRDYLLETMSEQDRCPSGSPDCDFAEAHELGLATRLTQMIENYSQVNRTYPCPKCLRNLIIAIAARLHLEAIKIDKKASVQNCSRSTNFAEAFAEAARERMLLVMAAVADLDSALDKGRLT